ncbi:MAG: hypothetical protein IBX69_02310 [Anaerolineales bacterium]|nr:hypothetical protein [Anaerolineales bacterium]
MRLGEIWLNEGIGKFRLSQRISYVQCAATTLSDVTGNGIIDNSIAGVESYQVWRGQGNGLFIAESETCY